MTDHHQPQVSPARQQQHLREIPPQEANGFLKKHSGVGFKEVFNGNDLASRYCLRRLLEGAPVKAPAEYTSQLLRLRDQESRQAEVRVMASRLAARLDGRPENSDEEHAWLEASLARSKAREWTEVKPFGDRLLEFAQKRPETIEFAEEMVKRISLLG